MRFLCFIKLVLFCFFTNIMAFAVEHRMAYSDLISNDLDQFLYNDSISLDREHNADIINMSAYQSGSLPIIEDFLSGRLDICIIAMTEEAELPALDDDKIIKIPFAYISSVIVVNSENPVSEITIDQLSEIYGDSSAAANFLSWRDFGISSFSNTSIKAYAVKEDNSISPDLFRYNVLREKSFNSSVTFDTEDNVKRMILQDKAAIGIFPKNPESPNLKALFLSLGEESIAYGPSIDNIYYFDYPIRLPFYIIYNVADTEKLYPLVNILLSDSVADIIEDNDFYPIPKIIREKLIIDLQLYLQENKGQTF